ncbi:haloacid dehalogenase-like family (plasmid) [Sinorhizobium americanum]|uniref:HAD superfamily hydrolase (TIGR01509 family) n=2 Tax=Sinorhizobium americanum TaxID=194963 RepID=A0A1L3LU87_9HYPH|nr:haloacid dehalogenase-like family [Sinorhizobium americanum]TCN27551.1 HAD superfamily hydrolase (TIGR01509 family) [Sinorhizobium americanum]
MTQCMPACESPGVLIFDCDGVLIDSESIATEVHVEALAKSGYAITAEAYNSRFIGMSDQQSYSIIEAEAGLRLPNDHHQRVMKEIAKRYACELKAIAGIRQALDAISLAKCVASSSDPEKLRFGLQITHLYDCFSPHVFSASEVPRGKPAPDLFLFAAENMKTQPANCLVIEDSVAGVQAAVAARMRVIGFVGGSHCVSGLAEKLLEAGATRTFNHMAVLPEILRHL